MEKVGDARTETITGSLRSTKGTSVMLLLIGAKATSRLHKGSTWTDKGQEGAAMRVQTSTVRNTLGGLRHSFSHQEADFENHAHLQDGVPCLISMFIQRVSEFPLCVRP